MSKDLSYDFDREADTYDDYYQSEYGRAVDAREKETMLKMVGDLPRERSLELGCGTGHWTAWFASLGFPLVALDRAEQMMAKAREKEISGVEYRIGDMLNLPFDDDSFAQVFSVAALSFTLDPELAIKEAVRVTRPGGSVVMAVLNDDSVIGWNKANNPTFEHACFFNPTSLKQALDAYRQVELRYTAYITPDFAVVEGDELKPGEEVKPAMMIFKLTKDK